jgi:Skp family chaperone for outer membrane proteins
MGHETKRRWMLGLALIACMGVGAYVSRATAGAAFKPTPPQSPVIATVDLEAVIKAMNERTDKEKALGTKGEEYKAKLKALQDEAESDKTKLGAEPEGPNKIAMAKALREKVFRMEFEGQYATKVLGEMQGEMLRELYLKIEAAAQTLATRYHYQLVLTSDEKAQINPGDPDSIKRAIAFKRMLYVDPAMDITTDIVDFLNNQYAAGPTAVTPKKKP